MKICVLSILCISKKNVYKDTEDTHVKRALNLGYSMKDYSIDKIILAHSVSQTNIERLTSFWQVRNISDYSNKEIFKPIMKPTYGYHWSSKFAKANIQLREDGDCTALKLLAWNMTEFTNILIVDLDTCILEDPKPWMLKYADKYFVAKTVSPYTRGYVGFASNIMYIQTSEIVFKIISDCAATASYVPYTNGDQDVIDTVFSAHKKYPHFFKFIHSKNQRECSLFNITMGKGRIRRTSLE